MFLITLNTLYLSFDIKIKTFFITDYKTNLNVINLS